MTQDRLPVRQWQELYRAGAFKKDNEQTRELAGWGEVDDPLNNWRVKKLSRLVLAVTHPFILDNYRVFFSVGQPNVGRKYGFVCFFPLAKEHFQCLFYIDMDHPYAREKWALSTDGTARVKRSSSVAMCVICSDTSTSWPMNWSRE